MNDPLISVESCPSFWATVFIAGDLVEIRNLCREYVLDGLCVSIVAADFVYTGGAESGAAITLINYARFPSTDDSITAEAISLGKWMICRLFQKSASVVTPEQSFWLHRELGKNR